MTDKTKAFITGLLASLALVIFYLAIMFLTMPSFKEIWSNFSRFWYLIIFLIIGFGIQVGLWQFLKNHSKHHYGSGATAGVSGASSGAAMVACCAHHLAEVLPIIGVSGAAIFLAQYQKPFLILGAVINLLGVGYMVNLYRKHQANYKVP